MVFLYKIKEANILLPTSNFLKMQTKGHQKQVKDVKAYRIANTRKVSIRKSMTIILALLRRHIGSKKKKSFLYVLMKADEMKIAHPSCPR
jgi:hypothetical protein